MTIDRAIEILNPEHRERYDGPDEVNEACRMGMEALERTRWIPVSERLPEEPGKYLCCVKSYLGNARVSDNAHHLEIGPIGSRNDTITFTRGNDGSIFAKVGCFFGTLAEFREKVGETHGENEHAQAYLLAAELAELRIDTTPEADKQETPDAERGTTENG